LTLIAIVHRAGDERDREPDLIPLL